MSVEPAGGAPRARPPSVLVTRPLPAGRQLVQLFQAAGLGAHLVPVLEVMPPLDDSELRLAAAEVLAGSYDWVVLTSANGVRALSAALVDGGAETHGAALPARLAVVGPATAAAAEAKGWRVELVPERYTGEGLLDAFAGVPVEGARVLLPVAEAARDTVSEGLRARGARVDVVIAYRAVVPGPEHVELLRSLLRDRQLDVLTFASPSAAEGLLELAGADVLRVPAVAIGPVTAGAAQALGFHVVAVASPHTAEGLVAAVSAWAEGR